MLHCIQKNIFGMMPIPNIVESVLVLENLTIYSHNPEVRYIEFLLMDSGSELSPEQDPVVWKILNFGLFALNSAN